MHVPADASAHADTRVRCGSLTAYMPLKGVVRNVKCKSNLCGMTLVQGRLAELLTTVILLSFSIAAICKCLLHTLQPCGLGQHLVEVVGSDAVTDARHVSSYITSCYSAQGFVYLTVVLHEHMVMSGFEALRQHC